MHCKVLVGDRLCSWCWISRGFAFSKETMTAWLLLDSPRYWLPFPPAPLPQYWLREGFSLGSLLNWSYLLQSFIGIVSVDILLALVFMFRESVFLVSNITRWKRFWEYQFAQSIFLEKIRKGSVLWSSPSSSWPFQKELFESSKDLS